MATKMNLLDMQKLGILNGEIGEEDVNAFNKNNVILTFSVTNEILSSEHNGRRVLPALNDRIITEGTWICAIQPTSGEYRARGVRKLDASFFFELKQGHRQQIVDILWEAHSEQIMQYFEERYSAEKEADKSAAVNEAVKPYVEEIEQLKEEKARLEHDLEMSRIIINSKPESVAEPVSEEPGTPTAVSRPVARRISEDTIICNMFEQPRYFVHISYDRKTMFIQPHPYGKTICLGRVLYLSNFGSLVPYNGECDLAIEHVEGKGFYIHFE